MSEQDTARLTDAVERIASALERIAGSAAYAPAQTSRPPYAGDYAPDYTPARPPSDRTVEIRTMIDGYPSIIVGGSDSNTCICPPGLPGMDLACGYHNAEG